MLVPVMLRSSGMKQQAAAFTVLVITLLATVSAASLAQEAEEERSRARFDAAADQAELAILYRMGDYEQVLRGARGLFVADPNTTRTEWRSYIDALDVERRYPGIQGIGWTKLLRPDEVEAHEASIRAEGFPDYAVRPEGERDLYTSIVYLEPFSGRNLRAFGYDMYSDPVRRDAMDRARDTGHAALSGKVRLVQETEEDVQNGFLLYLPVYRNGMPTDTVEARREATLGWVYSPFRAGDLMAGILGPNPDLRLFIYDTASVEDATLLFASENVTATPSANHRENTIKVAGREWSLRIEDTPDAGTPGFANRPTLVLLGGSSISILLFALAWNLASTRTRAESLAESMVAKLREGERALRESGEKLALTLEASRIGTWQWDLVQNVMTWDPQMHAIFGLAPGTFGGTLDDFIGFVHPDDQVRVRKTIEDAVEHGGEYVMDYRIIRADGVPRHLESRGRGYLDEEGRPLRMTGVRLDVTDRRAAQEALERQAAALARSNADLQQFAYVASHDLKMPLRHVASYAELLEKRNKEKLDERSEQFIQQIIGGVHRMGELIDNLLVYSRVETQGRPLGPTSADKACRDALGTLEPMRAETAARIDIAPLPDVLADEIQLRQLFQNLLQNAMKYRREDVPPHVTVDARQTDGWCEFSVRDNGIGIDPAAQETVFLMFHRLPPAHDLPGHGMGLAIAKRIVERHGGRIWVESSPGRGATFRFTLRAAVPTTGRTSGGLIAQGLAPPPAVSDAA